MTNVRSGRGGHVGLSVTVCGIGACDWLHALIVLKYRGVDLLGVYLAGGRWGLNRGNVGGNGVRSI